MGNFPQSFFASNLNGLKCPEMNVLATHTKKSVAVCKPFPIRYISFSYIIHDILGRYQSQQCEKNDNV